MHKTVLLNYNFFKADSELFLSTLWLGINAPCL